MRIYHHECVKLETEWTGRCYWFPDNKSTEINEKSGVKAIAKIEINSKFMYVLLCSFVTHIVVYYSAEGILSNAESYSTSKTVLVALGARMKLASVIGQH